MSVDTSCCKYSAVKQVGDRYAAANHAGDDSDATSSSCGQLLWHDTSVNHARVSALGPLQKLNHFVDMTLICRKASAATVLNRQRYFSEHFAFFPRSWTLPRDLPALTVAMQRPHPPVVIIKPAKGSQGAGISVCRTLAELQNASREKGGVIMQGCAQEYVDRPLLIDGFKFDLRLYVLVTSCSPLRVHLYRDGLVRLCTEKYHTAADDDSQQILSAAAGVAAARSASDWRKRHLTNYSINKLHDGFVAGEGGAKRRLGDVFDGLAREAGLDVGTHVTRRAHAHDSNPE